MHLTKEQREALERGVPMEAVLAMASTEVVTETQTQDQDPATTEAASAGAQEGQEAEVTIESLQAQVATLTEAKATAEGKLAEVQASADGFASKIQTLEAAAQSSQAQVKILAGIVSGYNAKMAVALGKTYDAADKTPEQVAAAHAELQPAMASAFQGGRRSVPAGSPASKEAQDAQAFRASIMARAENFKL